MFACAVILIQRNYSKGSSSRGPDGELRTEKTGESCKDFCLGSSFAADHRLALVLSAFTSFFFFYGLVFFLAAAKVCEHYLAPLRKFMVIIKIPHI